MAYNPYAFQNFNMGQPIMQQPQQQGEAGAKAMMTQPGMTAVMLDTENPVLYMKYTDPTGRPQEMQTRYLVTKEEYERLQAPVPDYVTREEFDSFKTSLKSEDEDEPTV